MHDSQRLTDPSPRIAPQPAIRIATKRRSKLATCDRQALEPPRTATDVRNARQLWRKFIVISSNRERRTLWHMLQAVCMQLMGRNLPDYAQILCKVLVRPDESANQPLALLAPAAMQTSKGPITRYGVDFAGSVDDRRIEPGSNRPRQGNIEIVLIAYYREMNGVTICGLMSSPLVF